jgi:hypothetical protein
MIACIACVQGLRARNDPRRVMVVSRVVKRAEYSTMDTFVEGDHCATRDDDLTRMSVVYDIFWPVVLLAESPSYF